MCVCVSVCVCKCVCVCVCVRERERGERDVEEAELKGQKVERWSFPIIINYHTSFYTSRSTFRL